jgi:hypothetical protein
MNQSCRGRRRRLRGVFAFRRAENRASRRSLRATGIWARRIARAQGPGAPASLGAVADVVITG